MNLTQGDLKAIREVVKEEIAVTMRATIKEELAPIHGELEALRNNIKDIYDMLVELQTNSNSVSNFEKMPLEAKILQLHQQVVRAAKQAGVTLPSNG